MYGRGKRVLLREYLEQRSDEERDRREAGHQPPHSPLLDQRPVSWSVTWTRRRCSTDRGRRSSARSTPIAGSWTVAWRSFRS